MGNTITLLTGLGLLAIGILLGYDRVSLIKKSIVTVGTVVRFEEVPDSDGGVAYEPVFKFTNYKNESMFFRSDLSGDKNDWQIGEKVKIAYQKDRYHKVLILTFFRTFIGTILFISGGLVCLFVASGYFWAQHFFNSLKKRPANLPPCLSFL
jgi:hypothetical protein